MVSFHPHVSKFKTLLSENEDENWTLKSGPKSTKTMGYSPCFLAKSGPTLTLLLMSFFLEFSSMTIFLSSSKLDSGQPESKSRRKWDFRKWSKIDQNHG